MDKLRALPPDLPLRVHRADGDPLEGSLRSVDETGSLVTLDVYDESAGLLRRVSLAQDTVYRVDYQERAVKPAFPVGGAVLGGILGYGLGSALLDPGNEGSGPEVLVSTLGGAALGFVLGLVLGPRHTQTVHIDCTY